MATLTSPAAASAVCPGPWSEDETVKIARAVRAQMGSVPASCGFVFASSGYMEQAEDFLEIIRLEAHIPILTGCTGSGLIGGSSELEFKEGFSLLALSLPDVDVKLEELPDDVEEAKPLLHGKSGAILLANPFTVDSEAWLDDWNASGHNHTPLIGGLASGSLSPSEVAVFANGSLTSAGVLLSFEGPLQMRPLVSQGCRPIGEPLIVTQAQGNLLMQLGGQPAYQVLKEAFDTLEESDRKRAQGNLFAGIASSEYREEFLQGDFLIRNIIGADPGTGAVAIGAQPRVGQTLQFQLRDAATAHEDLLGHAGHFAAHGPVPFASLLFSCAGRGSSLFGETGHDTRVLLNKLGDHPMAGFFCNGEIGPVGGRAFLHAYTASAALFCKAG